MTDAIVPHPFAFPEAVLDDLRDRLSRTRWPERETVNDWSQGAPSGESRRCATTGSAATTGVPVRRG
jgi:hypothetical protein